MIIFSATPIILSDLVGPTLPVHILHVQGILGSAPLCTRLGKA